MSFIDDVVNAHVVEFSSNFYEKHKKSLKKSKKLNNVFYMGLDKQFMIHSMISHSLDSALGFMFEDIAYTIAKEKFDDVKKSVTGFISSDTISYISKTLDSYHRKVSTPAISDYKNYSECGDMFDASHISDLYIVDGDSHYLFEVKMSGELDIKKARAEKESLLKEFFILRSNNIKDITCYLAMTYNMFGTNEFKHSTILRYFSKEELLVGKPFWDFICKSSTGYEDMLSSYNKNAYLINETIKKLGEELLNG